MPNIEGYFLMNNGLEIARARRKEKLANGEKLERRDPIEKAEAQPKSLRSVINGKCWDCVNGRGEPNGRKRISNCPCKGVCTLWPVRPYQRTEEA